MERGGWVCAAVFGAVLAMAGCTAVDDGVASLGDMASPPASAASVLGSQRERAEAMAACLEGKSISASLDDQVDGQALLEINPPPGAFAWVPADGGSMGAISAPGDAESLEMVEAAQSEGRTLLWLGGADRTADYESCVTETHFTQPGPYADAVAEQRTKQLETDLHNNFAACARANGFPDIEDLPAPVLDGGATRQVPGIMLPLGMTTEELVDLAAQCALYDEDRVRELADGVDNSNGNWVSNGMTGPNCCIFGLPGDDVTLREWSDDELAHADALYETLEEEKGRQLEELIAKLRAEGITYNGPRPG
jgi:hypothetical protein